MSSFSIPISNYLPRFIFSRIKLKKRGANYNTKVIAQLLESLCLLAQGKDKRYLSDFGYLNLQCEVLMVLFSYFLSYFKNHCKLSPETFNF